MIQKLSQQTEFPAVQFCRWQIFSSVKLWQEVCTCHVFHCCESGLYQTETFSEWASSQWFPANRWLFPTYTNFVSDRLVQTQYIFLSPWALLNTEQQKNTTVLEFEIKYKKYLECMFARNRNLNDNWTTATCKGEKLNSWCMHKFLPGWSCWWKPSNIFCKTFLSQLLCSWQSDYWEFILAR